MAPERDVHGQSAADDARGPAGSDVGGAEEARESALLLKEWREWVASWAAGRFFEASPDVARNWGLTRRREWYGALVGGLEVAASATFLQAPATFDAYVEWSADYLRLRGVDPRHMADALEVVTEGLEGGLVPGLEPSGVVRMLERGERVLRA